MATTYNIRYKNHATPQEQHTADGRFYLDSGVGRKMTGVCDVVDSNGDTLITTTGTYQNGLAVTDSPTTALTSSHEFIFIKNTGGGSGDDVIVTLNNSDYQILLSSGEAFASEISTSAVVKADCASSEDSTIEYFVSK